MLLVQNIVAQVPVRMKRVACSPIITYRHTMNDDISASELSSGNAQINSYDFGRFATWPDWASSGLRRDEESRGDSNLFRDSYHSTGP